MTAVEKVLVQILERANWIVNQTKQQSDSFNQYLATVCLIKQIPPPPWLQGQLFPPPRGCSNLNNNLFLTKNDDIESVVKIERSKSRQKALELRNTASLTKSGTCNINNREEELIKVVSSDECCGINEGRARLSNDGTDIVDQERCIGNGYVYEACSSPPTDESLLVEPKQLFFDRVQNCVMDTTDKENGRGSLGTARSTTPAEVLGEVSFSNGFLEKHNAQFLEKKRNSELMCREDTLDALVDMDQNKVGLGETCTQKLHVVANNVFRNQGKESQSLSDKGCRQANIASDTSCFVPLVQQERQPDALVTDTGPVSSQPVGACSSRLESDVVGSSSGVPEFLFSSPPCDDNIFVEPKQLLFDEVEDCNVSGSLTLQSEKEKGSGSPGNARSPTPAESLGVTHLSLHKKHAVLLEHQETEHFDAADAANRSILTQTITPKSAETSSTGRIVPYLLRSYTKHDNNDGFLKSEEPSFQRKSVRSKKNTNNASENSWPQYKRRKIEGRSSTAFTNSSRLVRVEPLHQIHENGVSRFHENAEYGSKTDLEFKHVTSSSDEKTSNSNAIKRPCKRLSRSAKRWARLNGVSHPASRSQAAWCLDVHQNHHLQGEQDAEGGQKDTNTCLRFEQTGVDASLVSDLGKEVCDNAEDCLSGSTDINITQLESDEQRYLLLPEIELDIQKIKQLGSTERALQDTGSTDLNVTQLPAEDHRHLMFHETALDIRNMDQLGSAERGLQNRGSATGEQLLSYCSVRSPSLEDVTGNQSMPEFEGFSIGLPSKQILSLPGERISLGNIDLPTTTNECISVIEKLCKSAGMLTPLAWSSKHKIHRTPDLYQSLPDGLPECMDLKRTVTFSDEDLKQLNGSYNLIGEESELASYSDCMPSSVQLDWGVPQPPFTPPVRTFNQRNTSVPAGRSFEKLQNTNPELTCFRIDENTSTSEENENLDEGSIESVNMGPNVSGMQISAKQKLRNAYGEEKRAKKDKENQKSSIGGKGGVSKVSDSLYSTRPKLSRKASEGKESQSLAGKGCRRGNIVSSMSSFIPLVQQKRQPAALVTGKRDVKVKALEAAVAAKKLEEKRENDRKMKKEAAKLERARLEQDKIKQLELQNKKSEEERKKKEADLAGRKRIREEEDRKEKERKRKCTEEARRLQDKLHAEKEEKVQRCRAADDKEGKKKEVQNKEQKNQKTEKGSQIADCRQKMETGTRNAKVPVGNAEKASDVRKDSVGVKADHDKVLDSICEPNNCGLSFTRESGEKSYEISPYQASDDEDEAAEEDEQDVPNKKFIPSWAREKHIASILPSMHRVDPCEIFLRASFCSISEDPLLTLTPRVLFSTRFVEHIVLRRKVLVSLLQQSSNPVSLLAWTLKFER
ncbi:hypothetical protein IFM89_022358 [Coptis chinensis]|uniref:Inner centromere protein ARK-binding domain-containing protein n=1 Tax=Coptis chinensis TaxID=261450 RepID=A0A835H216_9MAGN|nr:hypothetical protein IFM89_022358 [Coptis chinensis]